MDNLYDLERKARIANQTEEQQKIQLQILESCATDEEIILNLRTLINKRKQDPVCIRNLIKHLFNQAKSIEFYKNLLERVIEGKMYLEEERLYVAEYIKEQLGNNIREAYDVIKGIPVETFTSVNERRKNAFLFEQFRLSLLLHQYNDCELIVRRVRKSYLSKEELVIFLNYCILLRIGRRSFMDVSNLYIELNEVSESLKSVSLGSLFCIMSSCLVEGKNVIEDRRKLLEVFLESKNNDQKIRTFVKSFVTDLIIEPSYAEEILDAARAYEMNVAEEEAMNYIKRAIIEHNFFVAKKFFSKIYTRQLAMILQMEEEQTIEFICEMVNSGFSDVRIDQQDGIVDYGVKKWNNKVDNVLEKIVSANNLIHKEFISFSE
jgi:26S proteasome regulatory subunit N5